MEPREAVNKLRQRHSQAEIARLVSEKGVSTTQATISRIGSGDFKNPRFDLGTCIVQLCEELIE